MSSRMKARRGGKPNRGGGRFNRGGGRGHGGHRGGHGSHGGHSGGGGGQGRKVSDFDLDDLMDGPVLVDHRGASGGGSSSSSGRGVLKPTGRP